MTIQETFSDCGAVSDMRSINGIAIQPYRTHSSTHQLYLSQNLFKLDEVNSVGFLNWTPVIGFYSVV